jgi:zinc transport system substrate-binding protein
MLAEITRVLAAADPANAARYAANRDAALTTLDALDGEVRRLLQPVRARRYIVFHDAYGYFEKEFGLAPAGSISVAPGRPPGARRLAAIRQRIAAGGVACVFREPQFEPTLVQTILEGTRAQSGVLDSLGADLPAGPGAYPALIRNLARSLHDCLQGAAGKD